ncbi:hypothetical protein [Serinicoccus marinus]|uniref:hypothetical protein n=1 Tax=Serinicoccus marinus TaxID=247333 RepID=UPI00122E5920|nr:hypothetical protein [Serinicoccus marinus]
MDPVPTAAPPQDGGAVVEQRPGTRDASIPDEPDATTSPPVRLLVPDLGLDVPLDAVGVTDDGLMEVPRTPTGRAGTASAPRRVTTRGPPSSRATSTTGRAPVPSWR